MFKHLALLVTLIVPFSLQGEKPFRELIFQPGSAPFAMSHASTVVALPDGNRMAAWFGGSAEGKPDVGLDITYTWNRESIMYVHFPPADVSK